MQQPKERFKMNKIIVSAAAALLLAGTSAAFAQSTGSSDTGNGGAATTQDNNLSNAMPIDFATLDADGNGMLSLDEAKVAWPDLTQGELEAADMNHDGGLQEDEANSLNAQVGATESTVPSTDQTDDTDDNK
jgi:hypothetical protein